ALQGRDARGAPARRRHGGMQVPGHRVSGWTRPALVTAALVLGGCGQFFDWLGGEDDDAVYDGSRCELDGARIHCSHHSDTLWTGKTGVTPRVVHWQVPVGEAPAEGWPVAL